MGEESPPGLVPRSGSVTRLTVKLVAFGDLAVLLCLLSPELQRLAFHFSVC